MATKLETEKLNGQYVRFSITRDHPLS